MNKKKKIKWRSQKEIDNYFYLKKLNWIESPCYCSGLVLQKKFHKVLQNLNYSQLRQAAAVWKKTWTLQMRWFWSPSLAISFHLQPVSTHSTHSRQCLQSIDSSRGFKAFYCHSFYIHFYDKMGKGALQPESHSAPLTWGKEK